MASQSTSLQWLRRSAIFVCGWLFVAALLLVQFWPSIPQSKTQWALFIAFGPPLYFLAEFIMGKFVSPQLGSRIAPERFSFTRVLAGLLVALAILAAIWGSVWLLARL